MRPCRLVCKYHRFRVATCVPNCRIVKDSEIISHTLFTSILRAHMFWNVTLWFVEERLVRFFFKCWVPGPESAWWLREKSLSFAKCCCSMSRQSDSGAKRVAMRAIIRMFIVTCSYIYLLQWVPGFFPWGEGRGIKWSGRGIYHPPLFRAEVKERVELYLYSPCGPSWPVVGWTLRFYLIYLFIYGLMTVLLASGQCIVLATSLYMLNIVFLQ
jgi:hypothetical protein